MRDDDDGPAAEGGGGGADPKASALRHEVVAEVEVEDEGPKAPPPQQGVEAARAKPRRGR
jgi:hypothetical protein